jgi:hypothetical protein
MIPICAELEAEDLRRAISFSRLPKGSDLRRIFLR